MTVNAGLLKQVIHQIETHPELWDQTWWRTERPGCETAYCVAGWTAVLSGAAFVRQADGSLSETRVIPPGGGDPEDVDVYAARVLGLAPAEADEFCIPLFHGWNTWEDVQRIAGELITSGGAR